MRKIAALCIPTAALLMLSACVTTGNPQQRQSSITNAAMVTEAANCNQIAHSINTMDQIIVETGSQSTGNSYGTTNAINTGLAHSGLYGKAPYLSAIPGLTNSWSSASNQTQIERQQGYDAQREKQRLIGLFQQKKCVRSN
ncbi:MAG: hypothetical protein ACRBCK_01935 [Alphaproteobacteria bacterium]